MSYIRFKNRLSRSSINLKEASSRKSKLLVAWPLAALFASLVVPSLDLALARDFQNGISYLDSSYYKKGELPFEHCSIRHDLELSSYTKIIGSQAYVEFNKPSLGFGAPFKKIEPLHANYFLTCWVGVNTWAFSIPIHLGALITKGFSLELMGNALKFNFENLDGKELWQVEGDYKGTMSALGFLAAGHRGGTLVNPESGVALKMGGWYAGLFGVEVGKGSIQLGLGKDAVNLVDKTDKDKVKSIPGIMSFKFVKVRWNEVREEEQRSRVDAEERKHEDEAAKKEEAKKDETNPSKPTSPLMVNL